MIENLTTIKGVCSVYVDCGRKSQCDKWGTLPTTPKSGVCVPPYPP